jgi:hypothetical protein
MEVTMTRRITRTLGLAIGAMTLAVGAALAHGGDGPGSGAGHGPGFGPGHGPGCSPAAAAGPQGCGTAGGLAALLTPEERAAHRAKMASLASYDECRAYLTDFNRQLAAKAADKGQVPAGPGVWMCDRMKAHGRFTQ